VTERRLKVAEGTQVNIGGKVYAAGELVDLEPRTAASLVARGVVVVEVEKAPVAKKASRAK